MEVRNRGSWSPRQISRSIWPGSRRAREIQKLETRNPKQIRNANDPNRPRCAKQTQSAAGQKAPRRHREHGDGCKCFTSGYASPSVSSATLWLRSGSVRQTNPIRPGCGGPGGDLLALNRSGGGAYDTGDRDTTDCDGRLCASLTM